jgi:drug/metabolite transporter (DMT)-like permease
VVLVLISAATAAVGLVLTEIALRFFAVTALSIALLSNIAGGVVLLIPTLRRPNAWRGWPAADWLRLAAAALAVFALGFVLLYTAIGQIGSSKSSLLGRLEVIFVITLAVIFLGEQWSRRHWISSFLALGGAVLINFDLTVWQLKFGQGELLSVLAAFVFAAGIVAFKPLLDRRDASVVTGSGLLLGAVFLVPLFYADFGGVGAIGVATAIEPASLAGLGWLAWLTLGVRGVMLGVSWATYNVAMRHLGASRCSVLFLSLVLFTLALQTALDALAPGLGLQVPSNSVAAVLGGLMIFISIVVIQRGT